MVFSEARAAKLILKANLTKKLFSKLNGNKLLEPLSSSLLRFSPFVFMTHCMLYILCQTSPTRNLNNLHCYVIWYSIDFMLIYIQCMGDKIQFLVGCNVYTFSKKNVCNNTITQVLQPMIFVQGLL